MKQQVLNFFMTKAPALASKAPGDETRAVASSDVAKSAAKPVPTAEAAREAVDDTGPSAPSADAPEKKKKSRSRKAGGPSAGGPMADSALAKATPAQLRDELDR